MFQTILESKTLEIILRGFSFTTDQYFFLPIILIGYTFKNKDAFGKTLLIIMSSMLLNVCLKNYFAVPLKPWLAKEGFSFPSGHMQLVTAFWLSLLWNYPNRYLFTLSSIIPLAIASEILYFNYHDPKDVLAGFIVGALLASSINFLVKKNPILQKYPFFLSLLLATLGFTINLTLPSMTANHVNHIWLALGTLLGFGLGWQIHLLLPYPQNLKNNLISLSSSIFGVLLITYLFKHITLPSKAIWTFTYYFSLSLTLTLSPILLHKCLIPFKKQTS